MRAVSIRVDVLLGLLILVLFVFVRVMDDTDGPPKEGVAPYVAPIVQPDDGSLANAPPDTQDLLVPADPDIDLTDEAVPGHMKNHEGLVDALVNGLKSAKALARHGDYVRAKDHITKKLVRARQSKLGDTSLTNCAQFMRANQAAADEQYRIPCVPWNTTGLVRVQHKRFGLLASFDHLEPRPRDAKQKLRVAVEMSGHMRTYQDCAASCRFHLLRPNNALLFSATYPDVGNKRQGVRVQERDEPVELPVMQELYGPHLAAVYLLDLPTVTGQLRRWFPSIFGDTHWSWMIYQLFTMELVHNTTLQHLAPAAHDDTTLDLALSKNKADKKGRELARRWGSFDVIVRVRPDLYILGNVTLFQLAPDHGVLEFACGGTTFSGSFGNGVILRSPHHPRVIWDLDPLSDHSAVGFTANTSTFLQLFTDAVGLSVYQQRKQIFYHGSTVEKMWSDRAKKAQLAMLPVVGWHIMLRSARYHNVTRTGQYVSTGRRTKLMQMIFSATDGPGTQCPKPNCHMYKLFPIKPIKKQPGGKPPVRPVPGRDVMMVKTCDSKKTPAH
jgi:hypothetical protein